jgi:hypothetical protein
MPNSFRAFALDGENTQQTQPAFKLKNQIVTWGKLLWHAGFEYYETEV